MPYRDFVYDHPTKIVFGPNSLDKLAEMLKAHGARKILLTYGGGSIKRNVGVTASAVSSSAASASLYDRIAAQCRAAGIEWVDFPGCQPNPRSTWIDEAAKAYRDNNCNFILAGGGGSVLDASKAIGLIVANPHPDGVWHYLGNRAPFANPCEPLGTILTLSATGSEANGNFVITNAATQQKLALGNPSARPRFSICDPTLTCSVDAWQTASGTADIISHLLEQYLHVEDDVDVSDGLILGVMKAAIKWGPIALKNPSDYDARANLMWASTVALCGIAGAGHRCDWTTHALEHALSAVYDVSHGAGLACLTPYYLDYLSAQDEPGRIGRLGVQLFDVDPAGPNVAKETALAFQHFFSSMGLPATLRDFPGVTITEDSLPVMARKTVQFGPVGAGGYHPFDYAQALQVFTAAYRGMDAMD